MTKKQKVIGDTIATLLKAPATKKKPTIADRKYQIARWTKLSLIHSLDVPNTNIPHYIAEGLIKHLQEVATKSQEEISNIKQKSNETELTDLQAQLASLRNQLTIARRNNQVRQ